MMTILWIIVAFIALLLTAIITGKLMLNRKFKQQSNRLLARTKDISTRQYTSGQLEGLPPPVQRYFEHVLKDGQPYISHVNFRHDGQFKTGLDKSWTNITGEHFATMEQPGFIWKGTTALFTARDMYIDGKGRLIVSLLSLYNIVNAKGENYNQGELLRWLGESVLYPTNLLPCDRLKWFPLDAQHATLVFTYSGLSLSFTITFNGAGEIAQMETKRYMNESILETWVINLSDYREVQGVRVPWRLEVLWRLPQGDFSYARFNIQQITYNKHL